MLRSAGDGHDRHGAGSGADTAALRRNTGLATDRRRTWRLAPAMALRQAARRAATGTPAADDACETAREGKSCEASVVVPENSRWPGRIDRRNAMLAQPAMPRRGQQPGKQPNRNSVSDMRTMHGAINGRQECLPHGRQAQRSAPAANLACVLATCSEKATCSVAERHTTGRNEPVVRQATTRARDSCAGS